jgi:hypothetical protein
VIRTPLLGMELHCTYTTIEPAVMAAKTQGRCRVPVSRPTESPSVASDAIAWARLDRASVRSKCDHGRNVGPCHAETAGPRRALTCDFFIKRELGGEDSNPQ